MGTLVHRTSLFVCCFVLVFVFLSPLFGRKAVDGAGGVGPRSVLSGTPYGCSQRLPSPPGCCWRGLAGSGNTGSLKRASAE